MVFIGKYSQFFLNTFLVIFLKEHMVFYWQIALFLYFIAENCGKEENNIRFLTEIFLFWFFSIEFFL